MEALQGGKRRRGDWTKAARADKRPAALTSGWDPHDHHDNSGSGGRPRARLARTSPDATPTACDHQAPPRPVIKGCRCCGKLGHLKAKCPERQHRCGTCGKARSATFERSGCIAHLIIGYCAQVGHFPRTCPHALHISAKGDSTTSSGAKNTKTDSRTAPTLEDLNAEMDEYFTGTDELLGAEEQVGLSSACASAHHEYTSFAVVVDAGWLLAICTGG